MLKRIAVYAAGGLSAGLVVFLALSPLPWLALIPAMVVATCLELDA